MCDSAMVIPLLLHRRTFQLTRTTPIPPQSLRCMTASWAVVVCTRMTPNRQHRINTSTTMSTANRFWIESIRARRPCARVRVRSSSAKPTIPVRRSTRVGSASNSVVVLARETTAIAPSAPIAVCACRALTVRMNPRKVRS